MSVVIPRNTTIPTKMTRKNYQNPFDFQTSVLFLVYEGEMPIAKDNNFPGEFSIKDVPLATGVAKYDVSFDVDVNGILTVSAELVGSNNMNQITITNNSLRLSKDEIDCMVKDAEEYKAQEEEHKKASEAKNALENYVHYARGTLRGCGRKDGMKDMIVLKDAIEKAIRWLEWNYLHGEASKFEEKMKELEIICESVITKMRRIDKVVKSEIDVKSEIIEISD